MFFFFFLVTYFKKPLPTPSSQIISPMYFSSGSIVLFSMFQSMNYFELSFVRCELRIKAQVFFHMDLLLPNMVCCTDYPFPSELP